MILSRGLGGSKGLGNSEYLEQKLGEECINTFSPHPIAGHLMTIPFDAPW